MKCAVCKKAELRAYQKAYHKAYNQRPEVKARYRGRNNGKELFKHYILRCTRSQSFSEFRRTLERINKRFPLTEKQIQFALTAYYDVNEKKRLIE